MDKVIQDEILARALTMIWKEVLDELVGVARRLEKERRYWESVLRSTTGVGTYFIQSELSSVGDSVGVFAYISALPLRIYRALPPKDSFSLSSLTSLQTSALFPHSPSATISTLLSPYTLTRREVLRSLKAITQARDSIATRIGVLASQGPRWTSESLQDETIRLYGVLAQVLEVSSGPGSAISASSLLSILTDDLPRSSDRMSAVVSQHRRPSALTRLWFPLLFVPPVGYYLISTIGRNGPWIREQLRNARETVKGFIVQWVWEPLEGIGKTIRGGGEGLGVAPTTVQSDQAVSRYPRAFDGG